MSSMHFHHHTPMPAAGVVQLRNAITHRFGVEVPATVALDFPTISALAGFVAQKIAPLSKRNNSAPLASLSSLSSDWSTCSGESACLPIVDTFAFLFTWPAYLVLD